jgi:hypothetical protein
VEPCLAVLLTSFAGGGCAVNKYLGAGGKKKIYFARDTLLDRYGALPSSRRKEKTG